MLPIVEAPFAWTPLMIGAVAAGGVALFGAFFAGIVSVITAWRIGEKVSAIEGHVNSEKTASEGREIALLKENELLRSIIADHKATAALLAQATASQQAVDQHKDSL